METFDICNIIYWLPQIYTRTHQQLVLPPALRLMAHPSISAPVPTV